MLPTLRHFAAYAGPDSRRFGFNAIVSDPDLRFTFFPVWEGLVRTNARPAARVCPPPPALA